MSRGYASGEVAGTTDCGFRKKRARPIIDGKFGNDRSNKKLERLRSVGRLENLRSIGIVLKLTKLTKLTKLP